MRRIILSTIAVLAVAASSALAHGGFPTKIALPNAFAPEGIEIGHGQHRLRRLSRHGRHLGGRPAHRRGPRSWSRARPTCARRPGIEFDHGRLWVSGARFGNAIVYNARTGASITEIQLATGTAATFINDAVATKKAVYFTDSQRPGDLQGRHARERPARCGDDDPARRRLPARRGPVQPERHRRDGERQDADRRAERLAQAPDDRPEDRRRHDDRSRRLRPLERRRPAPATAGRCTSSRTATTRLRSSSSHMT